MGNAISWEIEARSRDEESMILRENFHIGNRRLGTQHIRRVTKAKHGATFIRGYGLVKLDQDQVEDFEWWQRTGRCKASPMAKIYAILLVRPEISQNKSRWAA